jgi:hypothetical protein
VTDVAIEETVESWMYGIYQQTWGMLLQPTVLTVFVRWKRILFWKREHKFSALGIQ